MRLLPENVGLAYIDDRTPQLGIGLEPEHQRKGHGTRIMKAGLEAAVEAGYRQVSLTVHPENPARKLYDKCGFVEIGLRKGFVLMLWKAGIE